MVSIRCRKCRNEEFKLEVEREGNYLVLSTRCTVCGEKERLVVLAKWFFLEHGHIESYNNIG